MHIPHLPRLFIGTGVKDALERQPEAVGGCDDCLDLAAEDLADDNEYQGRCLHYRQAITAKGGVQWRRAVRRQYPHCGSRNGNGSPVLNHPGDFPFGSDGCVDYGIIWAAVLSLVVRVEVVGLNLAVPRIPTEEVEREAKKTDS